MPPIVGNKLRRVIGAGADVRPGTRRDLKAVNDIYNHYVVESHITFGDDPMTMDARRDWFDHYAKAGRHRLLVAVAGDGAGGYATSSRYRPQPRYLTPAYAGPCPLPF